MIIYLTGFEPFGEHALNASWEAVKGFALSDPKIQLHKEQLPVDYRALRESLPARLNELHPDVILHLGVMSSKGFLRLERTALNHIGETLDNAGFRPEPRVIQSSGPSKLSARFPLEETLQAWRERGFEATLSDDAGSYLCNYSFYLSLNWAEGKSAQVVFLHVPVLGAPFTVEQLREAIDIALKQAMKALS